MQYLIGIYKAKLFDSRYFILLHQENFHYHVLLELMKRYDLKLNEEDKKEIIYDTNLFLLELIEKNNNNNVAMTISYWNKCIRAFIYNKLLIYLKQLKNISLYSPIYKKNDSKKERLLIDVISNTRKDNAFSDEVQEVICSFDSISQSFIYYKYSECLSNEEIAGILNISLDELSVLEKNILEDLSKNKYLKRLVKK